MAIPVWTPGQILTASDVNNWMVPNAVTKAADQSVTSSTVFVNDTALVLPVVANASYNFQCYLCYEGAALGTGDLKIQWITPAAATMRYQPLGIGTAGGMGFGTSNFASTVTAFGTGGAGVLQGATMIGTLVTHATAGSLQLQWAQSTSSVTATIMHAQSGLSLQRTG